MTMTKQPNSPQSGQHQAGGHNDAPRQQQQFEASGDNRIASQIREHMAVIGADGAKVGKVDHVEGNRIKLTREDWQGGGSEYDHHYLPLDKVQSIEGDKVRLTLAAAEATSLASRH
jgi:hypothetical protein